MNRETRGSGRMQQRLRALTETPLNFDRAELPSETVDGWTVDEFRHPLAGERPGEPEPGGAWEIARRLITGYGFADPSIVRAYYDPAGPLEGRTMLLRLRALGLFQVHVGVRVLDVIDERSERDGRPVQVWGWRYGTLRGHLERGEMSWEVWKWIDTGEVDFHVRAVSRRAAIANPIVAIGFRLVGPHERRVFLRSTRERMSELVEEALRSGGAQSLRDIADDLTARPLPGGDTPHGQLLSEE